MSKVKELTVSTKYSVGQMNQLADALELAGYTPNDVTKLRSKPETLKQFKSVLMGLSEVVITTHTIDCDSDPFIPDGWSIRKEGQPKNGVSGQLRWNTDEVSLYLCDEQKGGSIEGNKLRQKLKGQPVLNAVVLDYLLDHPQLIPEEWKGKFIFFWGTVYRSFNGDPLVRCLHWNGEQWIWSYYWIWSHWRDNDPAAVACK